MSAEISSVDKVHLRRCIELAAQALENGDAPFGSVLVDAGGDVLAEAMNRERSDRDPTAHPELALAQWAIAHVDPHERATATVYTSGEHCPMCAAAHGWMGLGRIVYVASSAQLASWLEEWGVPAGPVAPLPITDVVPGAVVQGPVDELVEEIKLLQRRRFG
jgi:tRNA(Arg) A34 adenosine deaminase TadA